MYLCIKLEEKLEKKGEKGERLVGAVVNGVGNVNYISLWVCERVDQKE